MKPELLTPNTEPVTKEDLATWKQWANHPNVRKSITANRMIRLIRHVEELERKASRYIGPYD